MIHIVNSKYKIIKKQLCISYISTFLFGVIWIFFNIIIDFYDIRVVINNLSYKPNMFSHGLGKKPVDTKY